MSHKRCVAQLGRALRSGRRGRRFKSCRIDYKKQIPQGICFFGSMSSVGVRFFESRSFIAFEGIMMFGRKFFVLWHSKQTFKCQSVN